MVMVDGAMAAGPMAPGSLTAARLAFAGASGFLLLLAALHVIKREVDPSWRFISEYAIGPYGWVMVLAFFSFALSYGALFVAVRPQIRTVDGRIGLALLLVSAAGLIVAALFTTDPVTARADEATTRGRLHRLGGTMGIAMPFAAALISAGLARNRAWASARRALGWATGLAWVGFLVAFVSLAVLLSGSGGRFGPDVPVGWSNRLEVLGYSVWLMVVSWHAMKLYNPRPSPDARAYDSPMPQR